jgi:GNAT superfamily N-acetyltransferase
MRAQEFLIENANAAQAWINRVYTRYPAQWENNHVMTWGSGDDQQFAMFELIPSMSRRGAVEVKWFQAYPLRQGVGSRAMQELQAMAREDGIALTLYPWDKGQVSQAKLTKFYRGQGFRPAVKGSKNMAWSPELNEELRVDVPNEEWLQDAIDYAVSKSPDRYGLPYMGKTTASVRNVVVPVSILRRIPGMRQEQSKVRHHDLAAIRKIMHTTGKLPLHAHTGQEYKPFINVAYDGSAWVNEGNHRIMAAAELGWESLPVEISYFDGGERVESGAMYPGKIGLA